MKNLILSLAAMTALAACAPQSPENTTISGRREVAQPPAPVIPQYDSVARDEIKWITIDGGQGQLDFNPRVDILFVIDNSDSMKSAQSNLVRNIDQFAAGIQKNKMIDYHIGVTSVWDSSAAFQKGTAKVYKNGEIRGGLVSKANNKSGLLAQTLNIGIAPLAQGGPETEEVFSAISAAIQTSNTGRGGANEGFFREDAQLVVVILTDADDSSSSINAEQLVAELHSFKKGEQEKVSVYAALVKASDSDEYKDYGLKIHPKYHPECFTAGKDNKTCSGFGPDRLLEFVVKANAIHGNSGEIRSKHIMSLVQENFGKDLSRIGNDIKARTLAKRIELPQRPRLNADGTPMIRVLYGKQTIAPSATAGWTYDATANAIVLSGDVSYTYVEGAKFQVDMVPVNIRK